MRSRSLLLVAFLVLLLPNLLFAQTNAGSLSGRVADDTGAALPGVTVTASNAATGFNRTVITEVDGTYRFPSLPIGTYEVTADLAGFGSVTTRNVEVNVSTDRTLNITLKQAAVKEQITVTAASPLIETTPSIGTVVSQREMQNLPLNGRQFANLGSLAPGTTLSVNSDPTKPGQLTIALNGGSGRNVNFLVDGGDNTDDTIGGALQNFNIEAVQEFAIQTQQYKAEYGRTTGGVLTVVTKTGTNDLEGSAYEFYRSKALNEATTTENGTKSPYRRDQYGASLGGPIIKDRAHFFATGERTNRRTNYVVDTVPGIDPITNLPKPPVYPELQGAVVGTPFKDDLLTAKASADINARQFLQVRYGYQKNADIYGASPATIPSALGTITNNYHSFLAGHTWQIGADKVNDFLFQDTHFKNSILPNSDEPYLAYPSGVQAGQNVNTPQTTTQIKRQYKDDFSWSSTLAGRRNDFKVGANYIDEPLLGGDFSSGLAGQYNVTADVKGAPISQITIFGGFAGYNTPIKQYNYYAQDDIAVSKQLTINAGIRYDLWKGFDLDQTSNPIWKTLSTQTKYNDAYLKDFQGGKGGRLKNDTNNWAPRLGFTYDLRGDAKNIIRGGFGRYYDFPYTNATILFPALSVQSNYGTVYSNGAPGGIKNPNGTFWKIGDPLPPNQLTSPDVNPPNEVASPTLATPYSDQISLGYSWQVNPWLGLNADVSHINYKDIPFRFRANPTDPTTGKSRFPAFGSFRIWYGNGHAKYNGLNLSGHARLGDKFELQGFYTLSKATGNVLAGADEFRITAADYQPDLRAVRDQSVNPLDPTCGACSGPLNTDARHRVTLSVLYKAPLGINVSGIVRYHSATPYTDWMGHDITGDGYGFDLAPGVSNVNSLRGDSFSQTDLRLSKSFKFFGNYGIEVIGEVFNLLNSKNAAGFRGNREVFDTDLKKFVPNPAFGTPSKFAGDPGLGEQRLAQLGLRVTF
ncbi:MAG TPA: TonB-dependent receptor [Thermoanaerobaculia bacterium]